MSLAAAEARWKTLSKAVDGQHHHQKLSTLDETAELFMSQSLALYDGQLSAYTIDAASSSLELKRKINWDIKRNLESYLSFLDASTIKLLQKK